MIEHTEVSSEDRGMFTLCKTLCEKSKSNPLDQMQMIVNMVVSEEFEFVTESGTKFKQQPCGA